VCLITNWRYDNEELPSVVRDPCMATPSLTYDFFAPSRIAFGWGRRQELALIARPLGRRALVVCGSRSLEAAGLLDELRVSLAAANIATELLGTISHEPEVSDVDDFTSQLVELRATEDAFVLAVGGGSAIDLGKAVAAMATNRQSPTVQDYLEGVGHGLKIEQPPLPVVAMPTTAGTGSEATKNAVISNHNPAFKKSLRSDLMIPRVVLIDPELTGGLPPAITAQTGMDAITQLVESYISCRAQPIPRALALQGLQLAVPAIEEAVHDGSSRRAREAMAHAALLSGMALANSGLGMAHGVAAALGVLCHLPHGLACAVMLPAALRANRARAAADLASLARAVLDRPPADETQAADAFIERITAICQNIGIPQRLRDVGVQQDQLPELVTGARGNSMSGNPRNVGNQELFTILEQMW
jgi:alcohol dehydrogenase class IV